MGNSISALPAVRSLLSDVAHLFIVHVSGLVCDYWGYSGWTFREGCDSLMGGCRGGLGTAADMGPALGGCGFIGCSGGGGGGGGRGEEISRRKETLQTYCSDPHRLGLGD